jgi:nicotinamidase-related amidase
MAALLIIDVQRYFLNAFTAHIPARVEALQARYSVSFATRFVNPPGSAYERLIGWNGCRPGSPDTELAFKPAPHTQVIEKSVYTVVNAAFLAALDAAGETEVHLCGLDTEACVSKCALDLFEAGVRPKVLARACASHAGADDHAAALKTLARLIGPAQIEPVNGQGE